MDSAVDFAFVLRDKYKCTVKEKLILLDTFDIKYKLDGKIFSYSYDIWSGMLVSTSQTIDNEWLRSFLESIELPELDGI